MEPAAAPPRKKVSRLAIVVPLVSLATGVACFVLFILPFIGSLTQPTFTYPGSTTVTIEKPGDWAVYERTGTSTQNGPVTTTQNRSTALRPADVTVTGPGGQSVSTVSVFTNETLSPGDGVYTAAVQFHADRAGQYTVEVSGDRSGRAIVARKLSDQFGDVVWWLVGMLGSGLVFVIGIIALIVSAVRTSRANRPTLPPYPPGPPMGPGPGPYPPGPYPPGPYPPGR